MKKILILIIFFFSCCETNLPTVSGNQNEIEIIIPENCDSVKNFLREIFSAPAHDLSPFEPIFDVIFLSPQQFRTQKKLHRNIFILQLNSTRNILFEKQENIWASPQIVLRLTFSKDSFALNFLKSYAEKIVEIFQESEFKRLNKVFQQIEDKNASEFLLKKFHFISLIPKKYQKTKDSLNFIWFLNENSEKNMGFFIYSLNFLQLSEKTFVYRRDSVLKRNVFGNLPHSFMKTETRFPLYFSEKKLKNKKIYIVKGLWKIENDFMGGVFVSYLLSCGKSNSYVVLDGYVYAPNQKKRSLLQEVESLFYFISVNSE